MNPVLEHVEKDLLIINEERKVKNLYQHGFAKSFIDPRPFLHYIEFNDLSPSKHPAFIISINRNEETMDITLFKGEHQCDNIRNNKTAKLKDFGKYSRSSLYEAIDFYYVEIFRIIDA